MEKNHLQAEAKRSERFTNSCLWLFRGHVIGGSCMERRTFLNREIISSFVWVAVGLVFCGGGVHYGLFAETGPEPGLLPFVAGIILSCLGLVVLISSCRSVWEEKKETERFFPETDSFRKVFFAVLGLCLYAFAFEYLGFLITNFLILIFLMRFIEPSKWTTVLIVALLTAGSFHLVFRIILKVPFPRGILGI